MRRYCEFIGDATKDFDEVPKSSRLCVHAGFSHCTLHKEPLTEDASGWRLCCPSCTLPFYVVRSEDAA